MSDIFRSTKKTLNATSGHAETSTAPPHPALSPMGRGGKRFTKAMRNTATSATPLPDGERRKKIHPLRLPYLYSRYPLEILFAVGVDNGNAAL